MAVPRVEKAYEKRAWIIPFALGAALFIEGLVVTLTGASDDPDLPAVAGVTWAQLSSTNPAVASYITLVARGLGTVTLLANFFLMAISLKSYRRGERWSWYALWAYPVLFGLIAATRFGAGAGAVAGLPFITVVIVVSLLGLLLPYRKFFPKK